MGFDRKIVACVKGGLLSASHKMPYCEHLFDSDHKLWPLTNHFSRSNDQQRMNTQNTNKWQQLDTQTYTQVQKHTENVPKQRKYPVDGICAEENYLVVSKVRMDRLVADDEKITFNIKQLLAITTRACRVAQKPPAGTQCTESSFSPTVAFQCGRNFFQKKKRATLP